MSDRHYGLEVGDERLKLAKKNLAGTFVKGTIDDQFLNVHGERYQIVTLFHVLEHVSNPIEFMTICFGLLSPGGWLLVEVPNLGDQLLKESRVYRDFYWQRAHLSYFDASRLELVFYNSGIKNFEIRGVQRYGLRNLYHWLDEGKPQLSDPQFTEVSPILSKLEDIYRSQRELSMTCDTLIAEVNK